MPSEGHAANEYAEFEDVDTDELDEDLDDDDDESDDDDSLAVQQAGRATPSRSVTVAQDAVSSADPTPEDSATQAPEAPPTVKVRRLSKEFASGDEVVRAVDGVSFSFAARQLVAITGPSGCGKTTLLYLLGSLEKPTAGTIQIDGIDVGGLSGHDADLFRRQKIGFVFQSFHLIPNLSALENVMLPMEIAGIPRSARQERAASLLQRVGIDQNRHNHRPGKLSGGQQQRVAIARALANDPSVILADEPTGNLDSKTSRIIVSLLRRLATQGCTVIIVTHDRSIARMADLRVDLIDGQIANMVAQTPAKAKVVEEPAPQRRRGAEPHRRKKARG